MLHRHPSSKTGYILLNMVDTPGHVDFGMEVSKSLDSVEGAVLLFDSARGVQAQTLSVYDKARRLGRMREAIADVGGGVGGENADDGDEGDGGDHGGDVDEEGRGGGEGRRRRGMTSGLGCGIRIIPALTKVDMPSARPLEVALAVSDLMGFDPDDILKTSARSRIGIKRLLDTICSEVPPPSQLPDDDGTILRAKVIDSWFETKRGVIALVRILSGTIGENDRISIIEPLSYEQIMSSKEQRGEIVGGEVGGDIVNGGSAHTVRKDTFSVQEGERMIIDQSYFLCILLSKAYESNHV